MSLPLHSLGPSPSVPLLSSDSNSIDVDVDEFDVTESTNYSTRQAKQDSDWVTIPYRRIFYTTFYALLTLALLTLLGFTIFIVGRGLLTYRQWTIPHRAAIATAKDGDRVVKPFFAPKKLGGVDRTVVGVKLWFREGVKEEEDHNRYWAHSIRNMQSNGENGFIISEKGVKNDWEEIWSKEILGGALEETKTDTISVKLPGRVVQSLTTNDDSRLIATFVLLPYSPLPDSRKNNYIHSSTRPVTKYGPSFPWPLPLSGSSTSSPGPLDAFLAHAGTGQSLNKRVVDWRAYRQPGGFVVIDEGEDRMDKMKYVGFVQSRTWVTVANDYPNYRLGGFERSMRELKEHKEQCANNTAYYGDCSRTFAQDGHFENLLQDGTESTQFDWKYGPFLTTRLSPSSPKDFVRLPEVAVEDFTFDWHLTYSAISPAKLAFVDAVPDRSYYDLLSNDSTTAKEHDRLELMSAFIGHSFNPESHPLARGVVGAVSVALRYLAIPFILHYWATRHVSTGISIYQLTIQTIIDLTYHITQSALNFYTVTIWVFVLTIISFLLLIFKQINLFLRLETMITKSVPLGESGFAVPVPGAIKIRKATVEEKASQKLDAKFDWRLRILIFVITFSLLRFAPPPPAIIAAEKFPDVMQGFGGFQHDNQTILMVIHILNAFVSSVWLVSRLSQIHLNHRNKTFAGNYGITTYALFGSLVLSHLTTIFVGWFGRVQVMQPFTTWDLITLLVQGVMVVQARKLPRVNQYPNEVLA